MKIEFKEIEQEDEFILLVNGIEDDLSYVYKIADKYFIRTKNQDLLFEIKKWSITDFNKYLIGNFEFDLEHDDYFYDKSVELENILEGETILKLLIQANYETWDNPYSISQLANEIERNCKESFMYIQEDEDAIFNGFGIKLRSLDNNEPVGKWINGIIREFELIYEKSVENLINKMNQDSLISYFNFPPEFESACKQYLVYFTDFLRDLGINAESNISTHLEQTIFTVTPKDKDHALELIKETLNVYLSLPTNSEVSTINVINEDIGVQQLISNIQFLNSQLVLGNAILQTKNVTIESLELMNFQLRQILDSREKELEKLNEGEDLIKGIVKVKKFENKGISINLGEVLKRIKRKL